MPLFLCASHPGNDDRAIAKMRRTKEKKLSDLVFTKQHLETIWAALEKHAAEGNARRTTGPQSVTVPLSRPTLEIRSEGSIGTAADDAAVFQNDVIDQRKSLSVEFEYHDYLKPQRRIRIQLTQGGGWWLQLSNSLSISGDDPRWVDATFAEFEGILGAVTPQSRTFRRVRPILFVVVAVAIGYAALRLLALLVSVDGGPPPTWAENVYYRVAVLLAASFGIGWGPAAWIIAWLGALWPSIEFDFGPEHLKQRKVWRLRVAAVGAIIAVPLLLEAFQRFVLEWR